MAVVILTAVLAPRRGADSRRDERLWPPLVLALAIAGAPAAVRADTAQAGRDVTVLVVGTDATRVVVGAGVLIGGGPELTIVTAAHVLRAGYAPAVRSADGVPLAIRSIEAIPGHDLALIRTAAPPLGLWRVAALGPLVAPGAPVFLWGHPAGRIYTLARGTVADPAPDLGPGPAGRFTIACASCDHGDSGAGVFDTHGVLLGILTDLVLDASGERTGLAVIEPAGAIQSAVRSPRNLIQKPIETSATIERTSPARAGCRTVASTASTRCRPARRPGTPARRSRWRGPRSSSPAIS